MGSESRHGKIKGSLQRSPRVCLHIGSCGGKGDGVPTTRRQALDLVEVEASMPAIGYETSVAATEVSMKLPVIHGHEFEPKLGRIGNRGVRSVFLRDVGQTIARAGGRKRQRVTELVDRRIGYVVGHRICVYHRVR